MLWILFLVLPAVPVQGKAYYATRQEMVARAEVIAIVDVAEIQKIKIQGSHWTYSESAQARVVKCLKGKLPDTITLLGKENFICAQVYFHQGRCLVFLKKDKSGYAGCNWAASCLPLDESGKVPWLATPESREASTPVPLEKAEEDIQLDLSRKI